MSDPSRVVAAFDLDGTLTDGGSVFRWLRYVTGGARTYAAATRLAGPIAWGALASGPAADRAKERLFSHLLAGLGADLVALKSVEFARTHVADRVRPACLERLHWHQGQGHHVVVVSASPELYVAEIGRLLGAEGTVATRLAVDPLGRLTGGYLGRNCRGEEKLRRLETFIERLELGGPAEIYAYGNSRGDRRMLAAADHGFDAGRLGPLGALRAYPRLSTPSPSA